MPNKILEKRENQYPEVVETAKFACDDINEQQNIELAILLSDLGKEKLLEKIKRECSIFETPLIRMAGLGKNAMVNWLLEQGHDVNQFNTKLLRFTPLREAISKQQLATVALLLSKGADPTIKDIFDLNGFEAARLTENQAIISLLDPHARVAQNSRSTKGIAQSITLGISKSPTDDQAIESAGIEEAERNSFKR